jgi:hypothetical protein
VAFEHNATQGALVHHQEERMNKQVKQDLAVLPDIFEDFKKEFPKLRLVEQVDMAARINAVRLSCEKLLEDAKDGFKLKTKSRDGIVPGTNFNAVVSVNSVTRLDQKVLKIEYPAVHAKCLRDNDEVRVDFKAR